MSKETLVSDSSGEFFSIGQDTNEKEIDTQKFLIKIKKEELKTKLEQERKEVKDTYYENLDTANHGDSFENLKNLSLEKSRDYLVTIQKWRGHIIEVNEDSFLAKLDDLTEGGTQEVAEFKQREVHPSERQFISLGTVFYFYIAYKISMGTLSKETVIKFQKPIQWNESNFDRASDRATRLSEFFEKKRTEKISSD